MSSEAKRKLSIIGSTLIGVKNPFYGKHHTKETKRILSIKYMGKKLTEEHKAKIRLNAKRGINHPKNIGKKWKLTDV